MSVSMYDPGLKEKAVAAIVKEKATESIFPVRDDEPEYAKLNDPTTQIENRYGNLINLVELDDTESLNINGVNQIGPNTNRNKQHAFHFTADNCIGCHACESACSEKNDLPAHISFRSVGYVEGGTYPNYTRMNISMACNHCDDPVCLKGCPTRAYTKHPEYGAVIQDPDICFGCGYCTWVCPYNAPQLDPVAGQVEKCNMCVDRLEVGLKPACVSACVGNALDFGVVENTPEGREQIDTQLPGFPDPSITQPNIRFQQVKDMPREVTRTDSAPVKYELDSDKKKYIPKVDKKTGVAKMWNLARLSSRENPLVIFTLATQAALGAFVAMVVGSLFNPALMAATQEASYSLLLFAVCVLTGLGLMLSASHLGKPMRFYRGYNNLRHSPVCREGLGITVFFMFAGLLFLCSLVSNTWANSFVDLSFASSVASLGADAFSVLAILGGIAGLYYMYRCYRIKARPFWNHWQTAAAFVGNSATLGGIVVGLFGGLIQANFELLEISAVMITAGLLLEGLGLIVHAKNMTGADHEGAASHYIQTSTFAKTYYLRNTLVGLNIALGVLLIAGVESQILWLVLALSVTAAAVIGRALFYVLVIPTTMPGAFFWKNKAFEQHAKDIGLAAWPQVGVVDDGH